MSDALSMSEYVSHNPVHQVIPGINIPCLRGVQGRSVQVTPNHVNLLKKTVNTLFGHEDKGTDEEFRLMFHHSGG